MGDEKYAFFQNPYQAEIMGQSEFLNIDITFTQNELFPYLLNIVAFDYLVLECEYELCHSLRKRKETEINSI